LLMRNAVVEPPVTIGKIGINVNQIARSVRLPEKERKISSFVQKFHAKTMNKLPFIIERMRPISAHISSIADILLFNGSPICRLMGTGAGRVPIGGTPESLLSLKMLIFNVQVGLSLIGNIPGETRRKENTIRFYKITIRIGIFIR